MRFTTILFQQSQRARVVVPDRFKVIKKQPYAASKSAEIATAEVNDFKIAIMERDFKSAYLVYKVLHRTKMLHCLSKEDHSIMMEFCATNYLPNKAAAMVSRVASNLLELGMELNLFDLHSLMQAYCHDDGDLEKIFFWYRYMKSEEIIPNTKIYALLIRTLGRSKHLNDAKSLYDEMISKVPGSECEAEPTCALMEAYAYGHDIQETEKIFDEKVELMKKGAIPKTIKYLDSMIECYAVLERVDKAFFVFNNMYKDLNIEKDLTSYDKIMFMFSLKDLSHLFSFYDVYDLWKSLLKFCVIEKNKRSKSVNNELNAATEVYRKSNPLDDVDTPTTLLHKYIESNPFEREEIFSFVINHKAKYGFIRYRSEDEKEDILNFTKREKELTKEDIGKIKPFNFSKEKPMKSTYNNFLQFLINKLKLQNKKNQSQNMSQFEINKTNQENLKLIYILFFEIAQNFGIPDEIVYDKIVSLFLNIKDYKSVEEWVDIITFRGFKLQYDTINEFQSKSFRAYLEEATPV
ncbi:hypothetical protein HK099_006620 [Clydaea vesicula]|uniref:Pentatricopeptide repeat-containing protein n=1 Tax=Clydaea vesicula TaxID=447962 RepID=A0AAD5TY24_9FUNG|nr:hypothetical protein HK099_006620 [Clydaea vesicula]